MINIVAVEDHCVFLTGLKTLIGEHADMRLVATTHDGSMLLDLLRKHPTDIVTMDLGTKIAEFDPVATVRAVKKEFPNIQVLVLTNYADPVWVRALVKVGISGYMLKTDPFSEEIAQVIRALYEGGEFFSPQITALVHNHTEEQIKLMNTERSTLTLLPEDLSTEAIADRVGLSVQRIRNVMTTLYDKFEIDRDGGVSPRIATINKARQLGMLPGGKMDANLVALLSRMEDNDRP